MLSSFIKPIMEDWSKSKPKLFFGLLLAQLSSTEFCVVFDPKVFDFFSFIEDSMCLFCLKIGSATGLVGDEV